MNMGRLSGSKIVSILMATSDCSVCVCVSSYSCRRSTYEEYLGATADCMMKLVPTCLAVGQLLFMRPHGQTNFIARGKYSCSVCTWILLMRGTVTFLKV